MPALTKYELNGLLPHAGPMRLLDSVESWDATAIRCRTQSHCDPANPLRQGGRLGAVTGIEYAAQAIAAHIGLVSGKRLREGTIGVLGGVRDVVLSVERLDDCNADLTIEAVRLFADERAYLYRFVLSLEGRQVMSGRVSIFLEEAPA